MAQFDASSPDRAIGRVVQALGTGQASAALAVTGGGLNVTLSGSWTGPAVLQRSFDGGSTWHPVFTPDGLVSRSYTAAVSFWHWEPEADVLYRVDGAGITAGTCNVRLSF